ncbi:MAG: hypothetical protein AVDCRST_MAG66-2567, partial [uncultured Pseudonocardia sp.]
WRRRRRAACRRPCCSWSAGCRCTRGRPWRSACSPCCRRPWWRCCGWRARPL